MRLLILLMILTPYKISCMESPDVPVQELINRFKSIRQEFHSFNLAQKNQVEAHPDLKSKTYDKKNVEKMMATNKENLIKKIDQLSKDSLEAYNKYKRIRAVPPSSEDVKELQQAFILWSIHTQSNYTSLEKLQHFSEQTHSKKEVSEEKKLKNLFPIKKNQVAPIAPGNL